MKTPETYPGPTLRLPLLRFNLHHLSLLTCLLLAAGAIFLGWSWWLSAPLIVILVLLVTDAIARPGSSLFYPTVSHGPRGDKRVALSFDDGPDPVVTPEVLDALREYGAKATFFVIGRTLDRYPELGRRMAAEGHAIGNHSWQHSRFQNFRPAAWHEAELARGEASITAVTGGGAVAYRPPVGLKSGELAQAAWRRRMPAMVAWSLHSRDTLFSDPERIARRVLTHVRGGDIILMHDGHDLPGRTRPVCAPALRLILAGLSERGFRCVTVPELLG